MALPVANRPRYSGPSPVTSLSTSTTGLDFAPLTLLHFLPRGFCPLEPTDARLLRLAGLVHDWCCGSGHDEMVELPRGKARMLRNSHVMIDVMTYLCQTVVHILRLRAESGGGNQHRLRGGCVIRLHCTLSASTSSRAGRRTATYRFLQLWHGPHWYPRQIHGTPQSRFGVYLIDILKRAMNAVSL